MNKRVFKTDKPKSLKAHQINDPKDDELKSNWKTPELLKYEKLRKAARWRKTRELVLSRNPICYFCHKFSDEVHHIDSKDETKFYELSNLVAICEQCHKKVNDAYRRKIDPEILFGELKKCQA